MCRASQRRAFHCVPRASCSSKPVCCHGFDLSCCTCQTSLRNLLDRDGRCVLDRDGRCVLDEVGCLICKACSQLKLPGCEEHKESLRAHELFICMCCLAPWHQRCAEIFSGRRGVSFESFVCAYCSDHQDYCSQVWEGKIWTHLAFNHPTHCRYPINPWTGFFDQKSVNLEVPLKTASKFRGSAQKPLKNACKFRGSSNSADFRGASRKVQI